MDIENEGGRFQIVRREGDGNEKYVSVDVITFIYVAIYRFDMQLDHVETRVFNLHITVISLMLIIAVRIDSQVFAEEVEPTGAVPIEMSLERYRYAALPNKFKEMSDDQRFQPRIMLKFFSGSHILSQV